MLLLLVFVLTQPYALFILPPLFPWVSLLLLVLAFAVAVKSELPEQITELTFRFRGALFRYPWLIYLGAALGGLLVAAELGMRSGSLVVFGIAVVVAIAMTVRQMWRNTEPTAWLQTTPRALYDQGEHRLFLLAILPPALTTFAGLFASSYEMHLGDPERVRTLLPFAILITLALRPGRQQFFRHCRWCRFEVSRAFYPFPGCERCSSNVWLHETRVDPSDDENRDSPRERGASPERAPHGEEATGRHHR